MYGLHLEFLLYSLVLIGAFLLALSLIPVSRIINELPNGWVRRSWKLLGLLILFFISGYLGYLVTAHHASASVVSLIVPIVFFFGAVFVLMVVTLALRTSSMIRRISILEQETVTDSLTGLFNRRYFDSELAQEIERSRRYDFPLSLLMLDVDHFKQVNDTHGHHTGDRVLKALGHRIMQLVRDTDIVVRYGGEEFAIIASHTDLEAAVNLAERIRHAVEMDGYLPDVDRLKREPLTVSIGVAMLNLATQDGNRFIESADAALLQAKQKGRNRVEVFEGQAAA